MKKLHTIVNLLAVALTGVALCVATPIGAQEASKETPSQQTPSDEKKSASRPLPLRRMKIESIDKEKRTITMGSKTYIVTQNTKITKDGAPFEFEKVEAGMTATGSYRKLDDGTLQLVSLKITTINSQDEQSQKQQEVNQ